MREHLQVHCDHCGAVWASDLNSWMFIYTNGEDWDETCPICGRVYEARLRFVRVKTPKADKPATAPRIRQTKGA